MCRLVFASRRESETDRRPRRGVPLQSMRRRSRAAISRFSSTESVGKMRRPSMQCAIPSSAIRCGGRPATSSARDAHRARGRRDGAADRARERRLAGAVGAENSDGLALRDGQVDALEHPSLAVAGFDAAKLEQGRSRGAGGGGGDQRCESAAPLDMQARGRVRGPALQINGGTPHRRFLRERHRCRDRPPRPRRWRRFPRSGLRPVSCRS